VEIKRKFKYKKNNEKQKKYKIENSYKKI